MQPSRSVTLSLAVLLLSAACGGTGSTATPRASGSATPSGAATLRPSSGAACDPKATPGQATAYPGWPGAVVPANPEIVPSLVSSELAIGSNRFLFTILDAANKPVPAPDVAVDLRFFDLANDPAKPGSELKASFLETAAGRGLYRATVDFDCAGDWGVEMIVKKAGIPDRTARGVFEVQATTSTPPLGSKMAPFDTPTSPPAALNTVTTDDTPDPDFYRLSVRQALEQQKPFLFILATPAFCKTRTCGPALDLIQTAAGPFKDRVAFINVEPYQLKFEGGSLQPVLAPNGDLLPIQIVDDLGLITEPFTFAVDRTGTIVAKFEGVMGRDELDTVLGQISK